MQSSDGSKPHVCVWSGHPELHRFMLSLTAQFSLSASREVSGLINSGPTWWSLMDLDADLEVNRKTTESTMLMPFVQLLSDQTRSAQVDNLILVPTLLLITCWIIDKLFLLPRALPPYLTAPN